jgi:hypothetical protein
MYVYTYVCKYIHTYVINTYILHLLFIMYVYMFVCIMNTHVLHLLFICMYICICIDVMHALYVKLEAAMRLRISLSV